MNKKIKKWIVSFVGIVLSIMLILSTIAYSIDPFFQFRTKDDSYMLSGWFVSSGLIKNYDYDMLILGSSMTQNFDMDVIREELKVNPLHIGLGGINSREIGELIGLAYETGNAEKFFVGVDMSIFTTDTNESRIPSYLLKDDMLSKFRYLLSYEVWFRYIPVDIAFMMLDGLGVELPIKFEYSKSIDKLEDWSLDYSFGEEIVLANYIGGKYAVSNVNTDDLYSRMVKNIDNFIANFDFEKGEHVFFFPPYSSLYWCNAQEQGYFDMYMQAKEYFVNNVSEYDVKVYDFQYAELTTNLDNYRDTSHYSSEVNDWMVKCFASQEYIVTKENLDMNKEILTTNTNAFRKKYAKLFE
ncbi:MAG: hypothetical protein IJE49_05025 [Agathobacter sp.]|nr:hypothetical protein [Agathobacter sp.]